MIGIVVSLEVVVVSLLLIHNKNIAMNTNQKDPGPSTAAQDCSGDSGCCSIADMGCC